MVRVNRNELQQNDLKRLFTQLDTTLARLDRTATTHFLSEVLGYEERLTVAKRLAAIVLLVEGYSQYKTAQLLKLSPSTTEKIAETIERGGFDHTLKILGKNKQEYFAVLKALDSILHLGGILPHYNGLDRYRHIR